MPLTASEDLSPELASALIDLTRTQEARLRQRLFYVSEMSSASRARRAGAALAGPRAPSR